MKRGVSCNGTSACSHLQQLDVGFAGYFLRCQSRRKNLRSRSYIIILPGAVYYLATAASIFVSIFLLADWTSPTYKIRVVPD